MNCSNSASTNNGKIRGKIEEDKKGNQDEIIKARESTTSIRESCESQKAAKKSAEKIDEKISKVLAL